MQGGFQSGPAHGESARLLPKHPKGIRHTDAARLEQRLPIHVRRFLSNESLCDLQTPIQFYNRWREFTPPGKEVPYRAMTITKLSLPMKWLLVLDGQLLRDY